MSEDRPNRIPWPPLIVAGCVLLGFVLGALAPLPWPAGAARNGLAAGGGILIASAVGLDIWAALSFRRRGTTIMPHKAASALVTGGPFRLSRNPIYLANLLLIAGLGLAFGEPWLLIVTPLAAILLMKLAIEREERHLQALFGPDWLAYAARVRRWI